jgi:hypothetical protein
MERIVRQVRKIKIYIPSYYVDGGMGFQGSTVKETVFYEGDYTTKEEIDKKIQKAQTEWDIEYPKRWCPYWYKEVQVHQWWETVEIISENSLQSNLSMI